MSEYVCTFIEPGRFIFSDGNNFKLNMNGQFLDKIAQLCNYMHSKGYELVQIVTKETFIFKKK
jgi:hypothetical protein